MCYNTPVKKRTSCAARYAFLVVIMSFVLACSDAPPPLDPEYLAEVEAWRQDRLERLTADDGWLTLTGLYWLGPGENRFGSGEDNAVVLPDASIPPVAGSLALDSGGTVTLTAEASAEVRVNGAVTTEASLTIGTAGAPDVVTVGRIQFFVISRNGRLAARVKDPQAVTRTSFTGIEHFPIDPSLKVEARLAPYDEPREVAVPTVLGEDATYVAPGLLRFEVDGVGQSLEPFLSGPEKDRYFVIFRDATSGVSTYGAGRFLYAQSVDERGATVLDFNLAYNPPCAFTPYATCPLPPPQNWLQVAIEAGEKYSGDVH